MAFDLHTVSVVDGSSITRQDRVILGMQNRVANGAGGGAGSAVTVAVTMNLPAAYNVHVTPDQACFTSVTSKANTGFNVVLTPKDGSTTLSAGHFDVTVLT